MEVSQGFPGRGETLYVRPPTWQHHLVFLCEPQVFRQMGAIVSMQLLSALPKHTYLHVQHGPRWMSEETPRLAQCSAALHVCESLDLSASCCLGQDCPC